MLTKTFLLFLPAVVYAQIRISIQAAANRNDARVTFQGSVTEIIPDEERVAWRLSDEQLKDAALAYSGGRPDDVFVKSPTPWNDLYATYGWQQVRRTLTPIRASIVNVNAQPGLLIQEDFINNSSSPALYTVELSQELQESISTSWTTDRELKIGQTISYGVNFIIGGAEGTSSIAFTSKWGEERIEGKTITIRTLNGVQVPVVPGQEAQAILSLQRGSMEIQVDYTATLSGVAACNYSKRYQGHHFRSYNINECLRAAGSPVIINSTEIIRIGFYSSMQAVIRDPNSSQVLYSGPVLLNENVF